jgi:hypothetical protein
MNGILTSILIIVTAIRWPRYHFAEGFSISSYSRFHGNRLQLSNHDVRYLRQSSTASSEITMRKQKASDRRTRRMQRGGEEVQERIRENLSRRELTITSSPMTRKGDWKLRRQGEPIDAQTKTGGRGRSRKRSLLYNSLSLYHNKFLNFLTTEYKAEVRQIIETDSSVRIFV